MPVVRSCSLLSFLLDLSVRTFRPKAPQNHSPRDILTLTAFWCYRLSFVACGLQPLFCYLFLHVPFMSDVLHTVLVNV